MGKPFQYKTPKTKGARPIGVSIAAVTTLVEESEETWGDGLPFGSEFEALAYKALRSLGWAEDQIRVQAPVYGGRDEKGGYVMDIIVYTPMPVAISLKGRYWHDDPYDEMIDDARLLEVFTNYEVIWDDEATTFDAMRQIMEQKVGRP
jgi:hypothetical protein